MKRLAPAPRVFQIRLCPCNWHTVQDNLEYLLPLIAESLVMTNQLEHFEDLSVEWITSTCEIGSGFVVPASSSPKEQGAANGLLVGILAALHLHLEQRAVLK